MTTDNYNLNIKPVRTALNALGRDQIRSLARDLKIEGTGTKSDTKLIDMILDLYKKMGTETRQRYAKRILGKQPTAADPYKIIGSSREEETGFKRVQDTATERKGPARKTDVGKSSGFDTKADTKPKPSTRKGAAVTEAGSVAGSMDKLEKSAREKARAMGYETKSNKRISDDMADEQLRKDIEKDKNKEPLRTKVTRGEGKLTAAQELKRLTQEAEKNKKSDDKLKRSAPKRTDNSDALADRLTARMMELQNKGMSNKEATEQLKKERAAGKFAKGGSVKKKKVATKKSNKGAQDFRGDYGCTMSTIDNRKKRK